MSKKYAIGFVFCFFTLPLFMIPMIEYGFAEAHPALYLMCCSLNGGIVPLVVVWLLEVWERMKKCES